jgi:transposase
MAPTFVTPYRLSGKRGRIAQRTATINRVRGLLSEFGIVLPLKAATVRREAMQQLEDLPGWANTVIGDLLTGTLRQGAARCKISNGAVRPLAATCPSRPTCYPSSHS